MEAVQTVQKQTTPCESGKDALQPPKITISEVGSLLCDSDQADLSLTPGLTSHEKEIDISGMTSKFKACSLGPEEV